jgi:hypothetical protein
MEKSNLCRDEATPCRCGRPSHRDGVCSECSRSTKQASEASTIRTEDDRLSELMRSSQ